MALLADAHLIGPQYVCCTESNDVDNESIMKTVERLKAAQRQVRARCVCGVLDWGAIRGLSGADEGRRG